jgi:hypothetical protein
LLPVLLRYTTYFAKGIHGWMAGRDSRPHCQRRQKLTSRPLLKLPDLRRKYYVNVGACIRKGRGLGATLSQEYSTPPPDLNFVRRTNRYKAGKFLHVIEYWSWILTDKERESSATKCEVPSGHDTLTHWAPVLNNGPFHRCRGPSSLGLPYRCASHPGKQEDCDDDIELAGIQLSNRIS